MKLCCSFDEVAKKANNALGKDDVNLFEHLNITNQEKLPQSKLMVSCLKRLVDDGLIEEAYLRGSFGRGHGDEHSDIDFFVVATPENLEKVYDTVAEHLAESGDVITDCHDRLVEDYGGMGFMFVAKNNKDNHIYQFDLYVAMKGVPPKNEVTITPRIYSKDSSYKWMEEYGNTQEKELPQAAQDFIKSKTSGDSTEDRLELLMQEMLLTLFVTSKHIKRGQVSRMIIDNQFVVGSAIEMLQTLTGYDSVGYSSIYLGNEVVDTALEHGDDEMKEAAHHLESFFDQPMDQQKLLDVLSYSKFVLEKACPEIYAKQKSSIELFEKEILAKDIQPLQQNIAKQSNGMKR